ncbi:hypothetical protein MG293_014788 [Ovis ammon polii]|uniref:Uncharacterized protein n=1 Tax=Ovis ammon polii TaxID=230172 RepID=A0AAD4TWJ8_OVIAM|nr:hypothetical protein MG293_014788 [Ovis ammon polii]
MLISCQYGIDHTLKKKRNHESKVSPNVHDPYGHPPLRCVVGSSKEGSSNSSTASELDDEPPCLEEIEYGTDSSSDQEGSFSELDQQIQECAFHKDEGEEEEEGTGQGRKAIP